MQKFAFFILFSVLTFSVFSQQKLSPAVSFPNTEHDFGKIKKNIPVTCDFIFTNKSPKPLVIVQVQTSCGCTTPKYPQMPILPGKSDKINVGYNAANLGVFRKTIFVQISGYPELKELVIKGEVIQ